MPVVRVTVSTAHGQVDLDLPVGATLGAVDPQLRAWAGVRAADGPVEYRVEDQVLEPEQLVGRWPVVDAAVIRIAPGSRAGLRRRPADRGAGAAAALTGAAAARAPWHLACVAGPAAGLLAAPAAGTGAVVLGRRGGTGLNRAAPGSIPSGGTGTGPAAAGVGPEARAALRLDDPALSALHLAARRRGRRWQVMDLGSTNGTWVLRPRRPPWRAAVDRVRQLPARSGRWRRAPAGRWRRIRPEQPIRCGHGVLVVRVATQSPPAGGHRRDAGTRPEAATSRPTAARRGLRSRASGLAGPAICAAVAVPVAWSALSGGGAGRGVLAAGLLGLAAPAALLLRRRRPALAVEDRHWRAGAGEPYRGPVPVAAPTSPVDQPDAGSAGAGPAAAPAAAVGAGDPGQLAVWLAAATDPSPPPPPPPSVEAGALLRNRSLAVVGPREVALAVSRAVLLSVLASTGTGCAVVHPRGAESAWRWCRWLPGVVASSAAVGIGPAMARAVLTGTAGPTVVSDGGARGGWSAQLGAWIRGSTNRACLLVEDDAADLPRWCTAVLRVDSDWTAQLHADGATVALPAAGVGTAWAEAAARALTSWVAQRDAGDAGQDGAGRGGPVAASAHRAPSLPPGPVAVADLPGMPAATAEAVRAAWSAARSDQGGREPHGEQKTPAADDRLAAVIGLAADGRPALIDLDAHGPHALVAGTTGAGKSELLQTLVLTMAARWPPDTLSIAMVDYKGGASFGRCADLPHVAGMVTDLDPEQAGRALAGLRAELTHRERAVAAAGAVDLAGLRRTATAGQAVPPRLLVVVDEFRAMAEDLPDFVPALVRLAAQGRSLGVHLVLATQRPAGAVSSDMRANLALRVCLRVTDPADSVDVIEHPGAADLPTDRPGLALVRAGTSAPVLVQTAWAAAPPGGAVALVHRSPSWTTLGSPQRAGAVRAPRAGHDDAMVAAITAAAAAAGIPAPPAPWSPPLPDLVTADHPALLTEDRSAASGGAAGHRPAAAQAWPAAHGGSAAHGGLPAHDGGAWPSSPLRLGLVDRPAERRWEPLDWAPASGHLLVQGAPGSGRSTALVRVAAEALRTGLPVQLLGHDSSWPRWLLDHAGTRTVVGPEDPRRLARLLTVLLAAEEPVAQVVLVDDLPAVVAAVDDPRGGPLLRLLTQARRRRVAVAASAPTTGVGTAMLGAFTTRLVLPVADAMEDAMLGVPRELAGSRRRPGRAVLLRSGDAAAAQVAMPPATGAATGAAIGADGSARAGSPADGAASARRSTAAMTAAPLIRPLPPLAMLPVTAASTGPPATGTPAGVGCVLAVGVGGDHAEPVLVAPATGVLVVGPPGSGRSTALTTLAVQAQGVIGGGAGAGGRAGQDSRPADDSEHPVDGWLLIGDGMGPAAELLCVGRPGARWLRGIGELARLTDAEIATSRLLVLDDLDLAERLDPHQVDRLSRLAGPTTTGTAPGEPPAGHGRPLLLASAQTAGAAIAFRGLLAVLRSARCGVVLCPTAGATEVFGTDLTASADPAHGARPGRGVVVQGATATPVQVYLPR